MLRPVETPTPQSFRFWLMRSRPGEEFVYHTGNLMADRCYPVITGTYAEPDPIARYKAAAERENAQDPEFVTLPIAAVEAMAQIAWQAHLDGDVELTQRRLGWNYFAYVARKRPKALEHAWKEAA